MSAADQTQQGVPSGRWTADAVHSWLGFEASGTPR